MKVLLQVEELKTVVQFIRLAVDAKPASEVLKNLLFSLSKGRLFAKGTNMLATHINSLVPCAGTDMPEGTTFTMNNVDLHNLLGRLDDQIISIDVDLETYHHKVKYKGGNQIINGENPLTFPGRKKEDPLINLTFGPVERTAFIDGIKAVHFSCGKPDYNPVMSGVNIRTTSDRITFIAMSTYVGSVYPVPASNLPEIDCTAQKSFITSVIRADAETDQMLSMKLIISKTGIQAIIGEFIVMSILINDKYPDFLQMVKAFTWEKELQVSKGQFTGALSRALLTADQYTSELKLTLFPGHVLLQSNDTQKGTSTMEEVAAVSDSSDFSIWITGTSLLEVIDNTKGERLKFLFKDQRTAIKVIGEYADAYSICMPTFPKQA